MSIAARIRVLLVDDTDDIRLLLRTNLEIDGRFEIVGEATDGRQAVDAAARAHPDAVVLDIAMPVMDGLTAATLIREVAPDCKIVALSGFDARRMSQRSADAGVHRYVEKGTSLREIADVIAELCGRPRAEADGDIAERRAAVWDKDERFRRVYEDGPLGVAMIGPDFRILEANPALGALTGIPPHRLVGRNLVDLTHPEDVGADADLADRLFHGTERSARAQKRIVRADGSVVWVETVATVVRTATGSPLYGMVLVDDVSERKQAEEELTGELLERTREAEQLQDAHDTRTAILAALSHDLRTPLTVLLGVAGTLERAIGKLPEETILDMLSRISANAQRLDDMLTDLLDAERVARNAVYVETRPVDARRVIQEVTAVLDEDVRGRISVDVGTGRVMGDEALLERTLDNLIANALRHAPGSDVWVRLVQEGERASIVVEDAGKGISPDLRERIFEPFERGEATATGTGMGLAIARGFVEAMGGTLTVGDRPGGGASFTIVLRAA